MQKKRAKGRWFRRCHRMTSRTYANDDVVCEDMITSAKATIIKGVVLPYSHATICTRIIATAKSRVPKPYSNDLLRYRFKRARAAARV